MALDHFLYNAGGLDSPGTHAEAVTPGATDLTNISRALYIGGAGNVVVIMQGGETVTFSSVPAGAILPIRVSRVTAATTATNIVSLY